MRLTWASEGVGDEDNSKVICEEHNARLSYSEIPWKTLEMLLAEANMLMLDYAPSSIESNKQWDSASLVNVENAISKVILILGKQRRTESTYFRIERDTLRRNQDVPDVCAVEVIDPKTRESVGIYDKSNLP